MLWSPLRLFFCVSHSDCFRFGHSLFFATFLPLLSLWPPLRLFFCVSHSDCFCFGHSLFFRVFLFATSLPLLSPWPQLCLFFWITHSDCFCFGRRCLFVSISFLRLPLLLLWSPLSLLKSVFAFVPPFLLSPLPSASLSTLGLYPSPSLPFRPGSHHRSGRRRGHSARPRWGGPRSRRRASCGCRARPG